MSFRKPSGRGLPSISTAASTSFQGGTNVDIFTALAAVSGDSDNMASEAADEAIGEPGVRRSGIPSSAQSLGSDAARSEAPTDVSITQQTWLADLKGTVARSTIVTEIMDGKTENLLSGTQMSKFILSNDMAAQLLALISCSPERHQV